MYKIYTTLGIPSRFIHKFMLVMKLTTIFIFIVVLQVSATSYGQKVTLKRQNARLEQVFKEIRKQTGYDFLFNVQHIQNAKPVSINLTGLNISEAMKICLSGQPFDFSLADKTVIIKKREPSLFERIKTYIIASDVKGVVTDTTGAPLVGALVKIKGTKTQTATNSSGIFHLSNVPEGAILTITYIGYETKEVLASAAKKIVLQSSISPLDDVQIIAYGTTTKRLNTGAIGTIKAETIDKQPVGNVLTALTARIPGLDITQQGGVPGSGVTVRIRGTNSLTATANDPLFLIDGVPFLNNSTATTSQSSFRPPAGGNSSPFNSLNPADIESVEVLKDADATAIYGSRGANGVILITTKKGKSGETKFDVNFSSGFGKVARTIEVLNRREYLDMRYEALRNDGVTIETTPRSVHDLKDWDTTRTTDWQKELIGKTAKYNNMQLNLSGGNSNTSYSMGGNYWKETTVFPGDFADTKGSGRFSILHHSTNKKLKAQLTGTFLKENNQLPTNDLVHLATTLPPIAPPLYTLDGKLNFAGSTFENPMAELQRTYDSKAANLNANGLLSYRIIDGLEMKANFGYSNFRFRTLYLNPESAQNPAYFSGPASRLSEFGDHTTETWNIEPQISYNTLLIGNAFNILIGSTFQRTLQEGILNYTSGYIDDVLMKDRSLATASSANTSYSEYKYNAVFLRVNYNIKNKYIANLTARRDGSSRFGPGKQFGNFGAIGAAWLFTEENGFKETIPFLSFGKLRASYGITGSDAVGNYAYLSLYSTASSSYPYYGANGVGIQPSRLFNTEFQWETNKKTDVALELGFLKDRILLNFNYYRNRSSNQLVGYPVSGVAGFTSIPLNLPATVQNNGWEMELNTINIKHKEFSWSSGINLTIPRNKLVDYPLLSSSSNANNYVVGQPITIVKVLPTLGVDPSTGTMVYQNRFGERVTNISTITVSDRTIAINTGKHFYGGFSNTFNYKRFQLDVFTNFSKQTGLIYNVNGIGTLGAISNMPKYVYQGRWQYPGHQAMLNKLTQSQTSDAYRARARNTDAAAYDDFFYMRLKNVSLSYQFNPEWIKKLKLQNFRIYAQGQNLATITNYKGMDPENLGASIAPIAVSTFGVQLTF